MASRWRTKTGIQIGERHIRAVVVQKKGGEWVTVKQAADSLPGGIVRGGEVLQPHLLGLRLKSLLRENGIRAGRVSVFLEDLPLFVRRFAFPPMTKGELARAVAYKMKLELPVDPDDFFIRHVPLGAMRGGEGGQPEEHAVVAVRKSAVRKLEEALRSAGLSALAVGLEPEAVYRGLAALVEGSGMETVCREAVAPAAGAGPEAVDRGLTESSAGYGPEAVDRGLTESSAGIGPETVHQGLAVPAGERERTGPDAVADGGENVLIAKMGEGRLMLSIHVRGRLVHARYLPAEGAREDREKEIRRTLLAWHAEERDKPVRKIVLLGREEDWKDTKESLERSFPVRVKVADAPWAACLGMALMPPNQCDVRPRRTLAAAAADAPVPVKIGMLLPVLLVAAIAWEYGSVVKLEKEILALRQKIASHRAVEAMLSERTTLLSLSREMESMRGHFAQQHVSPSSLYRYLVNQAPPQIVISQITFHQTEVTVSGEAAGPREAVAFLRRLQEDGRFEEVRLVHAGDGGGGTAFAIRAYGKGAFTGAQAE